MPSISVIIPNYNYAGYLDERLESLWAQTFTDFEVVFVDDASTDDSRAVVERHRDRRLRAMWHDTRSRSPYERWNDGAAHAEGRFLCFAGADDACEPAFLEALMSALTRHPHAGIAYARSRIVDAEGVARGLTPAHPRWDRDFVSTAAEELPYLLDQRTIPTASAVLIRRELFERCGRFDTSFALAADHMLWAKALREAAVAYVSAPLNRFRTHDRTVRAQASHAARVAERHRVYGFLLDAFSVDDDAREHTRDRLAKNWLDCWAGDSAHAGHRRIHAAARRADPHLYSRLARLWVERRLGIRVKSPSAILRYARRRLTDELYLLGGRRILWRYSSYYAKARQAYRVDHPRAAAPALPVHALGIAVTRPGETPGSLQLRPDHVDRVRRVAAAVDRALAQPANCRFVPRLTSASLMGATTSIPEVANGDVIAIQLQDPLSLDGLQELCEPLLEELERVVFGSYVVADKVYVYRSPVSRQEPRGTWVWHFDNHPREVLKVMVYLTDVTAATAPFEYLRSRASGTPIVGAPLAPMHHRSRVTPAAIERHLANGDEGHPVTGPHGTVIVFDDNIVHRANVARDGLRDVVVFQVRPSMFKVRPFCDPRWTGSFLHQNVSRDPDDFMPRLKAAAEAV